MKRQALRMIGTAVLFVLNATSTLAGTAQPGGSIHYQDPPDVGSAGTQTGQGEKGDCPATHLPLTALVPINAWGQTVNQHPTFWFYVPYASSADLPAKFVLQDRNGTDVYPISVRLPEVPGIVSVQIPSTIPPLKVNERYQWFFQVECSSPALAVSGWIQRVKLAPKLKQQIEAATPRQRAILYAQNSVWYDALTILAELHRDHPRDTNIAADWATLLDQVKLQEIATQSITR